MAAMIVAAMFGRDRIHVIGDALRHRPSPCVLNTHKLVLSSVPLLRYPVVCVLGILSRGSSRPLTEPIYRTQQRHKYKVSRI